VDRNAREPPSPGEIRWGQKSTDSLVGLEKPLINLKNPGIISVPLGVLFLIFGSLLYRRRIDVNADDKWKALVFRRDSGIGVDGAAAH